MDAVPTQGLETLPSILRPSTVLNNHLLTFKVKGYTIECDFSKWILFSYLFKCPLNYL